jgi:hypothetical protein
MSSCVKCYANVFLFILFFIPPFFPIFLPFYLLGPRELQALVAEGRGVIASQVSRSSQLVLGHSRALGAALGELEQQAKLALRATAEAVHEEFDCVAAVLSVLEQVAAADSEVLAVLCSASASCSSGGGGGTEASRKKSSSKSSSSGGSGCSVRKVLFQSISNNTADFQMMSSMLAPSYGVAGAEGAGPMKKRGQAAVKGYNFEAQYQAVRGDCARLEVAKLYKIILYPSLGFDAMNLSGENSAFSGTATAAYERTKYERVYTILTPEQWQLVLKQGWAALGHSPVFSADAGVNSSV